MFDYSARIEAFRDQKVRLSSDLEALLLSHRKANRDRLISRLPSEISGLTIGETSFRPQGSFAMQTVIQTRLSPKPPNEDLFMARSSSSAVLAPELPIQAPVEEPIINSPYIEPKCHWAYDKSGKANKISGRRDARYFWTTQRVMTGQTEIESIGGDFGSEPLPLVNALRSDVSRWRASRYENATQVTKKLLAHWTRADRKRRLFFCQLEAVETVIYLNEILASGRRTKFKPEVTADDYSAMVKGIRQ